MDKAHVIIEVSILAGVLFLIVFQVMKKDSAKPQSEVGYRNELITTAIQHTINGIVVVDENWLIKLWSAGAERIFGWKEAEVINQPLSLIFSTERDYARLTQEPREYTKQQEFTGRHRLSGATFTNDIPIGVTLNEFRIGPLVHYTCVIKNIRERKEQEQQHKVETELLNMGEEIGGFGTFMWTVATNRVVCSDGLRELFNTDDFVSDFEDLMKCIWWEDQQMVRDFLFQQLKNKADYQFKYRVSQPNGRPIEVIATGRMFLEGGLLHHVGGVVQKINKWM